MSRPGASIVARNVGVRYDLRLTHRRTLRRAMGELIHRNREVGSTSFWALRNVSFELGHGEALGIVGKNGSGKSTLMLTLAGVLRPDEGFVTTFGRASTLLTLGAGFDADATGRENIFLNGAFLGFSRAKIAASLDEIIEFSGLGAFIDVPLRKYSAGMRSRLGFSIAAHIEPEILLLDEVLGVGDEEFRQRSRERMFELMSRSKALVIVSHDLSFVERTCSACLWLSEGEAGAFGAPADVTRAYQQSATHAAGPVRTLQ
jgi:ABC-type polysaccharide/polyol phosphate transport system ATPase subunit